MHTLTTTSIRRLALAGAALLLALVPARPALAVQRPGFSMEILVEGVPLQELTARGATYVEALEGREYSVRMTNHTAERVAIALSVDGLNSIDARSTTLRQASKWIVGPYGTLTVDGWQTSSSTARRFFFTTEERSYGAWLGRTTNLGVVSAAVFREDRPFPTPRPYAPGRREGADPGEPGPNDAPEKSKRRGDLSRDAASSRVESEAIRESDVADDLAATGIGRELDHRVQRVEFRAQAAPTALLELRYEYHGALVRLGVLPDPAAWIGGPLDRREHARGFIDEGFSPDPFRRDR